MFKILALLILGVLISSSVLAAPTTEDIPTVSIIDMQHIKNVDGSYQYSHENSDGTSHQETSVVKNAGTEDEAMEVQGSYRYINENGETVEVSYTAGVDGFVPKGSIINPEITAAAEAAKDLPKPDMNQE
ncbi:endocuticle structural protein SgAbd-6 [Drosophila grimshawi]|uniref:GH21942 n=1 Tax=Drosophila grimshawi TaxID=7222 RepID=B4J8I4_DROGR|nr:endocuticle structural protein SgAbd-6 [Drosophila grimshawi]EDW02343.1 GH21942 [Drosophila grimshawi]